MRYVLSGMTKTSDVMSMGAATINEDDTVFAALELLVQHRISALPVLDAAGKLAGILTQGDFLRLNEFYLAEVLAKPYDERRRDLDARQVREIMSHGCVTIGPDATLTEAVDLMERRGLKRLPVVADGKLVGLLSRSDLLRALID